MKSTFKSKVVIFLIVCFVFGAGFFANALLNAMDQTYLVDHVQDYGERIIYLNDVLDGVQIESPELRSDINKAFISDLFCSPTFFYFLLKAVEYETEEHNLNEFWEGYFEAFKYSNLTESEISKHDFDCDSSL